LERAAREVQGFGIGSELTVRIAEIEASLSNSPAEKVEALLAEQNVEPSLLGSALAIKALSSQINVLIHAAGMLAALPHILVEYEKIESLSLGAGNTGRAHDLETDLRIAEFKFIEWRGGSESIRQNSLFQAVFNLDTSDSAKRKQLFVLGTEQPLRFLGNKRALSSVLSRNAKLATRFSDLYGERFKTVDEYWKSVKDRVELIDLREIVPLLSSP
jgi:hypothetical protein